MFAAGGREDEPSEMDALPTGFLRMLDLTEEDGVGVVELLSKTLGGRSGAYRGVSFHPASKRGSDGRRG